MIFKCRVDLGSYDSDLKGCVLTFAMFSREQSTSLTKKLAKFVGLDPDKLADMGTEAILEIEKEANAVTYDALCNAYISGSVKDENGETREATKEDIQTFPGIVAKDILELLQGSVKKK